MANEGAAGTGLITNMTGGDNSGNTKIAFTRGSLKYDTPFLDMTSTFIPRTIKAILRFVAAYVLGDGLVAQCIAKMAEYPITSLIYNDDTKGAIKDDKSTEYWKDLLEKKLKMLRVLKQCGMDYYAYGNSIISISYPFKRMLECPRCHVKHSAESLRVKFRGFKFYADCTTKGCHYNGAMEPSDVLTKEVSKIAIVHWDLMNIDIKYNSITGDHFYFYTVPVDLANAIRRGDMDLVKTTRLEVIEAVRRRKQLKLMSDNVFHMKRPAPQYIIPSERGWGIPVVMPVMKDIFHIKILKKGNEMISFDHIVPLRLLFPSGTGDISPHATMNLGTWRTKVEAEIQKWRVDPNYISIMPLPLGMQNLGGDARLLMVTPEIKMTEDSIITGIGIIPEIVRGGATWSGSNVSLRVVENTFLNHRADIDSLKDFIIDNLSTYLGKPKINVSMSDFKMADDLQKKQMMIQAATGDARTAIVSKTTVTKELDFDPDEEFEYMKEETKKRIELTIQQMEGDAEAQGAASIVSALYQADAQMENQTRLETRNREAQARRDNERAVMSERSAVGVDQEVGSLSDQAGAQPQGVSVPNLILLLTQRFSRLAQVDRNEFKIRMLAMKNTTPNLYQEVYNNLKEMNLIEADTIPDLATVQQYTPGQIPSASQGEMYAEQPLSAAEAGASVGALPEQRPPRSATSTV